MNDQQTTIQDLKDLALKFRDDRNWEQFHNAKDLSLYLSLEAAELLEIFAWIQEKNLEKHVKEKRQDIEHEIADITLILLHFCNKYSIDLSKAFNEKLALTTAKYPIEKAKNKYEKSTEL